MRENPQYWVPLRFRTRGVHLLVCLLVRLTAQRLLTNPGLVHLFLARRVLLPRRGPVRRRPGQQSPRGDAPVSFQLLAPRCAGHCPYHWCWCGGGCLRAGPKAQCGPWLWTGANRDYGVKARSRNAGCHSGDDLFYARRRAQGILSQVWAPGFYSPGQLARTPPIVHPNLFLGRRPDWRRGRSSWRGGRDCGRDP